MGSVCEIGLELVGLEKNGPIFISTLVPWFHLTLHFLFLAVRLVCSLSSAIKT